MIENLLDGDGVVDVGRDLELPPALATREGVDMEDLRDEARPVRATAARLLPGATSAHAIGIVAVACPPSLRATGGCEVCAGGASGQVLRMVVRAVIAIGRSRSRPARTIDSSRGRPSALYSLTRSSNDPVVNPIPSG